MTRSDVGHRKERSGTWARVCFNITAQKEGGSRDNVFNELENATMGENAAGCEFALFSIGIGVLFQARRDP